MLTDWLTDMHLRPAGEMALLGRYIDTTSRTQRATLSWTATALFVETRNAALTLAEAVTRYRNGEMAPGSGLIDPRPK